MTFDGSVTKIGDGAFNGYVFTDIATHLTSITIPNSVEYIGDGAFCDCDGLTSIAIPNSVTTIDPDAFSWCDNLTTVNIGEKVSSIGDKTFFRCVNLTTIYCEATTPPTLVSDVFALCSNIEQVYVPDQSVDLYKAADGWSTYANRMTGYKF
ncbi:MAG: leucine-rich repeat domain-containing protein [Rikenellaceae bacterium]|nr:leucine-rich repeat domain-containing protein [Rikenellaceae bacterium]